MLVMARDRDYADLLPDLEGRRVLIWTCGTCARLCRGLGGREAADSLSARLSADGVEVAGVAMSSACCLMSKAASMAGSAAPHDVVLALCCDMGARNAGAATGSPVINPVVTFGPGYLDLDGTPRVASAVCGTVVMDESLEDAARESGCRVGPFRGAIISAVPNAAD